MRGRHDASFFLHGEFPMSKQQLQRDCQWPGHQQPGDGLLPEHDGRTSERHGLGTEL